MNRSIFPEAFVDRLTRLLHVDSVKIRDLFVKKPLSIRINTIIASYNNVVQELTHNDIGFEAVSWYKDALILPQQTARTLTQLPLYQAGKIYIQSLSSMIPALVLNPKPDDKVLDMAAAPGSKTSQIAALMGNGGKIIANDIDTGRIFKLNAVLDMLKVENVSITKQAGQALWQSYPETFDTVLLDAPCSMEGRFVADDPSTYDHWSLKKVRSLSKLQKWMLRSAVSAAKVGGTIVYSTCTLSPEENEEVIDWILKKEKGAIGLEEVSLPGLALQNGLTDWGKDTYLPELTKTKRIVPSSKMEGFFIAKLKKIHSNTRIINV